MDSFTTEFGRTIPFVPGYREAHRKVETAKPGQILTEDAYDPARKKPVTYSGFYKDAYLYGMMADTFERCGITPSFDSMLEVGGSEGAVARLAKTDGLAQHAQVVELFDMRPLLPDDLYASHLRRHRIYCLLYKLGSTSRAKRTALFNSHAYWPNSADKLYNIGRKGDGKIDEYTIRDFYELNGRYNLISSQCSMDYFEPPKFFKKSAELLPKGGYLYIHLAYWWYIVNMTHLAGHFPYVAQRLTRDDVMRYLDEVHPGERERFQPLYDYYHCGSMKPVLWEYVAMADSVGLEALFTLRHMPFGGTKRTPITPETISSEMGLSTVLEDVNRHAPEVKTLDLKTSHITLLFRRR